MFIRLEHNRGDLASSPAVAPMAEVERHAASLTISIPSANKTMKQCPVTTDSSLQPNGRVSEPETTGKPAWDFDDEFDGGEETCGRVIVNLHLYIRDQPPGYRIMVISRDPGAPMELPAWCRMTRNALTAMQHPYYLITLKPHLERS